MAKQKEARHTKEREARCNAVIEHLEARAEGQHKKKAGRSALGPVMGVSAPMQETKGKVNKNKDKLLVWLLQLSAQAMMSHSFGA